MERHHFYILCFCIAFIIEISLLLLSKNVRSAREQFAMIVIAVAVYFITLLFTAIFREPRRPSATGAVFAKPVEKPLFTQPLESTPQKMQPQPTPLPQTAPLEERRGLQRTEMISPVHPDSARTLVKEGVVPPSVGEPYRPPPLPTIVPAGLIKPPSSAPTERFRDIVSQQLAAPSPETRRRALESIVPTGLDYKELAERAKGIKLSLLGWWPMGWSRVTLESGAPPQFWKFDKGRLVAGVFVGFDDEQKEYIVWTAESAGGVFKNIRERARCSSEEEVVARVKDIVKEVRSSTA
jgi:hypothetical protein